MKLIVAADENCGIGHKGKLLFSIPEDMRYFKENTLNKAVVMGRKTFESLPGGRPLAGRANIVLSRDVSFAPAGVTVCRTADGVLEAVKVYPAEDVFIIGGEKVYREFISYCDTALITKVHAVKEADSFFPDIDRMKNWKKVWESEVKTHGELRFTFTKYVNCDIL